MELTIRYPRKNNGSFAMVGKEKLIHMLPWMTAMSSTGIPADLKVNRSTMRTARMETMLTTVLSLAKHFFRSY